MRIFRYLFREVLLATVAVTAVVMLIVVSARFVRMLAHAAAGEIAGNILFTILFYRLPNFVELILPLGLFIGIILAYGRLYEDSEMAVLRACGFSDTRLWRYTLVPVILIALVMSINSLYLSPAGEAKVQSIRRDPRYYGGLSTLVPGQFQQLPDSSAVAYAERLDGDRTQLSGVFFAEPVGRAADGGQQVRLVVARSARVVLDPDGRHGRYLELHNGFEYRGEPGRADFSAAAFDRYGTRVFEPTGRIERSEELDAVPTWQLLHASQPKYLSTLQWRLSLPILLPVVATLALSFARTGHRRGRYARLFPAVLTYLIYLVMLSNIRSAISDGRMPPYPGLWAVHVCFFGLGIALLYAPRWWLALRAPRRAEGR